MKKYDVVVVGGGPNGLAAAIVMAEAGRSVLVREAREAVGGGAVSAALTLPGFVHDTFSAVHPLGVGSPLLRRLPLAAYGLEWIHPPAPLAHPFDDRPAASLERSIEATGGTLGRDADAYRKLIGPFAADWDRLAVEILGPLRISRHPFLMARFGLRALRSAAGLTRHTFAGEPSRALFCGVAAHAGTPLTAAGTAAFGLVLHAAGHAVGWPLPRGGAGAISRALESHLRSLGGVIETDARVRSLADLPAARTVFFDVTPRQLLGIAGERLPAGYRRALERYRYGPGVFKLDWALTDPIPWKDPGCARAGTLHLGGSDAEIAASLSAVWSGRVPERPFVILAQPSLFDPTRAPPGRHTAWAYCHVPNGSTTDMTAPIEAQIERFAPGFRDVVLARSAMTPALLERRNENLVGGDISGGATVLSQLFFRPAVRRKPHAIPVPGFFLCSSSTPPGGGVHGMCGYHAARTALAAGF